MKSNGQLIEPRPVVRKPQGRENVPAISPFLLRWFTWYARRYIRRHFHAVRVTPLGLPPACRGLPVVIYLNHASWWDPLICVLLKDCFFPNRRAFAPIDARMLERYAFFKKLGFFPVQREGRRGAEEFLRRSTTILDSAENVLFITPEGRFVDVRERPVRFAKGIGHLAARAERVAFVPLAIEYVFWEARLPEVLVQFGAPLELQPEAKEVFDGRYWTKLFELKLAEAQDALAKEAQLRNPSDFSILLQGTGGVSTFYDMWRTLRGKRPQEDRTT